MNHRLKWVVLLTFLSVVCAAQSARDFRRKYGPADPKGRYIVRPAIAATVRFEENGQPCQILLEPQSPPLSRMDLSLMKKEVIDEVIGEFVPAARNDHRRPALTMGMGCSSSEEYRYKEITVHRTIACKPDGGRGISSAEIRWEARKCK